MAQDKNNISKAQNSGADFLEINTGIVRVPVRDPYGREDFIVFNPSDAVFRKHFFEMTNDVEKKQLEFEKQEKEIKKKYSESLGEPLLEKGAENLNKNEKRQLMGVDAEYNALENDICDFCEKSIDRVFGEKTCEKVFGGDRVVFAYGKLLQALVPYFKGSASSVMDEYMKEKNSRQQNRKSYNSKYNAQKANGRK